MRTLRIPCADHHAATAAMEELQSEGVDVNGVDGRFVLVPATWSAMFVFDLAELVQSNGYGYDEELANWASAAASARPNSDPGAIRNQTAARS